MCLKTHHCLQRPGIELFRAHLPDIVVTDISMPGMSGLDMARGIK